MYQLFETMALALMLGVIAAAWLPAFVLDKVFHQRLWDYTGTVLSWGNLNGYICARSVITWGIFGLIEMYGLVPLEEKFQKRLPKAFNIVTFALFGLFALDIVLSLTIK